MLRWERGGQDLYPLLDERIAADPELRRRVRVDMYRRLGFYPTETSEHSSEYVPWYLHHPSEVERLRLNVGEYVDISAENLAEYHRVREQLARSERLEVRSEATEYAPQVIHSLETGTIARHLGERGEPRPDLQPARRLRGGGADASWTPSVPTRCASATCRRSARR